MEELANLVKFQHEYGISDEILRSALYLLAEKWDNPPSSIFPVHNGIVVFEWEDDGECIEQIKIDKYRSGLLLTTHPSSTERIKW